MESHTISTIMETTTNMSTSPPITHEPSRAKNQTDVDHDTRKYIFVGGLILDTCAVVSSLTVLAYIGYKQLFRNRASAHFIAHLQIVNLIVTLYLVPTILYSIKTGGWVLNSSYGACRFHAFLVCLLLTVVAYMTTSIAGIHFITFARIHYDQLFGLHASIICAISWIIGFSLALPVLTNNSITRYRAEFYYCLPADTAQHTLQFMSYMVLFSLLLPNLLIWYAYARIIAVIQHSPIVFEALGLLRSRYLAVIIIILSMTPIPFYVLLCLPGQHALAYPVSFLCAILPTIFSGPLYGLSILVMKEDDIALTHRRSMVTTGANAPYVGVGLAVNPRFV